MVRVGCEPKGGHREAPRTHHGSRRDHILQLESQQGQAPGSRDSGGDENQNGPRGYSQIGSRRWWAMGMLEPNWGQSRAVF